LRACVRPVVSRVWFARQSGPLRYPRCVFLSLARVPQTATLFPYTTLFRSRGSRPGMDTAGVATDCGGAPAAGRRGGRGDQQQERSEEHTSELQSHLKLVCRLLLEKKKKE